MSGYRGGRGGYRDRDRDSYRDRDRERERDGDRDWRDRDYDREPRRDARYDDARRRYDSHEGLERPLGEAYDRNGDRRRPPRDYDRPPPRRFERDDWDYDRPARYGPPPGGRYDDVPRGPRAYRRDSRSSSPPSGPRYDRDMRPLDFDRAPPPPSRRRSRSPSAQSSSSRRPRSPDRRPLSPGPIDREKLRLAPIAKSPLESGEERTDSPGTAKTISSTATSGSGSLSIRGSATAATSSAGGPSRGLHGKNITIAQPSDSKTTLRDNANAATSAPAEPRVSAGSRDIPRQPPSRPHSPPPNEPALPTGPRALREGGRGGYYQGPPRRGGGWDRGSGRGGYAASSSGMGTYASRPSQRDVREPAPSSSTLEDDKRSFAGERRGSIGDSQSTRQARPPSPGPGKSPWHAATPRRDTVAEAAWGQAPTPSSRLPGDSRSSPQDAKHGQEAKQPSAMQGSSPAVQLRESEQGWGGGSPSMVKGKPTSWDDEPSSAGLARRDSRGGSGWGASESGTNSPGGWSHQQSALGTDLRRTGPFQKGRQFAGPSHRLEAIRDEVEKEKEKKTRELYEAEPWRAHIDAASALRKRRDEELDKTLLSFSSATRKALRDLEILEGEISAVNLNRKLRKEHLDTYKGTFMGDMSSYSSGVVAMI